MLPQNDLEKGHYVSELKKNKNVCTFSCRHISGRHDSRPGTCILQGEGVLPEIITRNRLFQDYFM